MQISATIANLDRRRLLMRFDFLGALNGAKRLNGWNDLNGHRYCLARGIDLFLEAQFQLEKPASKLLNRAYFASFLS